MKYDCQICNKNHELYFGISAGISQNLSEILKENPERVIDLEGLYMVDKTVVIISAQLLIPTEYDENFFYETWVECNAKTFISFSENYKNEKGGEIEGRLYDDLIPYFEKSKNLKCIIKYDPNMKSTDKPNIIILDESEIKNFQQKGLTKIELHTLLNRLHHIGQNNT